METTCKLVQPTSDPACCHDNIHGNNVNWTLNLTHVSTLVWFVLLALVECLFSVCNDKYIQCVFTG